MSYDKMIFAQNLRHFMASRGEQQSDVAALLGVSKTSVSDYCNGNQIPRMDKVQILAKHYNVSVSALLENAPGDTEQARDPFDLMYALWGDADDMDENDVQAVLDYAAYIRARKRGIDKSK